MDRIKDRNAPLTRAIDLEPRGAAPACPCLPPHRSYECLLLRGTTAVYLLDPPNPTRFFFYFILPHLNLRFTKVHQPTYPCDVGIRP
jgi:hypothetical protein